MLQLLPCLPTSSRRKLAAGMIGMAGWLACQVAAAAAADRIVLKLGGHFDAAAVSVNQGHGRGLRSESIVSSGEVYVQGKLSLDNGWDIGARFEFEVERDNGLSGTGPDLQYRDDLIDEAWVYIEGAFGRVELGQQDGVADQIMYFAPTVSKSIRVNNPDIYMLECAPSVSCSSSPTGRPYAPNGIQLRTDMHVSEDYSKVVYYTPRFYGFQAGISYTPELTRNFSGFGTRQSGQANQQSKIWELGLNFGETFAGVDVGLSAAWLKGSNEAPATIFAPGFAPDDVEEFGFGAKVGYREFTLGGSYRKTNVQGGIGILNDATLSPFTYNVYRDHDTVIWEAGIKYQKGPWSLGANYVKADAETPNFTTSQKAEAFEVAAGHVIGPGIEVAAGYQHYDFKGPQNRCDGVECDTTDAGVFFLETTISF
ncbi:MAG TPA: hypothetical protein DCL54_09630 [Alphaproteobacteria bacterium]|nr:hypothetical protein [Alphaproteobacteria bacterium]